MNSDTLYNAVKVAEKVIVTIVYSALSAGTCSTIGAVVGGLIGAGTGYLIGLTSGLLLGSQLSK